MLTYRLGGTEHKLLHPSVVRPLRGQALGAHSRPAPRFSKLADSWLRGSRGLPGGWTRCYPYAPTRGVSLASHIGRPARPRFVPVTPGRNASRGIVGRENFLLARPHGGDAIVRARHEHERWLRAIITIGATDPHSIQLASFYISKTAYSPPDWVVETPTYQRLLVNELRSCGLSVRKTRLSWHLAAPFPHTRNYPPTYSQRGNVTRNLYHVRTMSLTAGSLSGCVSSPPTIPRAVVLASVKS
eukprot:1552237-Pleurochrysis_carterae.AAC.1